MRILSVHNRFRQYAGSDAVAASDEAMLAEHGEVFSYTRESSEVESAGAWQRMRQGVGAIYSTRTVHEVAEIVRSFRPDIAYVHNVFPLISPSLYHALYRLRVPSVHVIHDFRILCPNSRFYVNDHLCENCKLGNYWSAISQRCVKDNYAYSAMYAASLYMNRHLGLLRHIGGYICLTQFAKNLLSEAGISERKLYVRPNYIDTSRFAPQFGGGNYALYLGGLYRDKGIMTVVEAFRHLPNVPLKIVGTGAEEREVRDYIAAHRLSNVELLGFKTGDDKLDCIRNSMFTIVPSHVYENFPMVVLEAFASGKPVIASGIGALPYIIQPEHTGLLFESQNARDLAEKVQWLRDRPAQIESMGRNARAVVEHKYDHGQRYPSLHAIFEKVIQQAGLEWGTVSPVKCAAPASV